VRDAPPPLSPQAVAVLSALLGHAAPRDAVGAPLADLLERAAVRAEPLESAALTREARAPSSTRPRGGEPPRALRRLARRWRADEFIAGPPAAVDVQALAPDGVLPESTLEALRTLDAERSRATAERVQAVETARRDEPRRVRRAILATRAVVARAQAEAQRDAVTLALALAERLLGEEPSAHAAWASWLEAAVRAAAARIGERATLTAHVHADDVARWAERIGGLGVEIRGDARVQAGDLWLSSSEGALDLRRSTVLRAVLARTVARYAGPP